MILNMLKIECYCLFDIEVTGVTGHVKNVTFPWTTKTGLIINDEQKLSEARNRQRNFDTLIQLISMRTQMFDIENPRIVTEINNPFKGHDRCWMFSFEIEPQAQWLVDDDDFWLLKQDSDGTPMITGLGESSEISSVIDATGDRPNIIYRYV